tara:strand:- start:2458 stop:2694 length:237 start_codon:yes stop_codon:yes gene_type:complete
MNYKIVNKNTNATYFLNEKEYETFFKVNSLYIDGEFKYKVYNITKAKAKRNAKMLDVVSYFAILGASMLATILYIQNY